MRRIFPVSFYDYFRINKGEELVKGVLGEEDLDSENVVGESK